MGLNIVVHATGIEDWVKSLTMSQSVGMLMFPKKVGGYVTFLEVN